MLQVLIVDDMDIVRRELKRLKLWGERTGFIISDEAKNGYEALEKLEKSQFDMVITDIRMPKIDGIELLKKITERKLCQCVILLSDHSEFKYARQGLVLGAFDYIIKPVDEEVIDSLLLRAKEFILSKRFEQNRIKQLEERLEEKVEVFFPEFEVNRLIDAIKAGDARTIEYANYLADIVFVNLNQDLIKAESLLNSILNVINSEIIETRNWLEKFISTNEIGEIDFSEANEWGAIKSAFLSVIERMVNMLRRLEFCTQDKGIVEQVCNYVLENVDEEISLTTAADSMFLNKYYMSGAFKQKAGITFIEYLTIVKMERAKKLIREGRLKIYEIAELLGFKDIEYFSKLFKKYTSFSPTEYRQNTSRII